MKDILYFNSVEDIRLLDALRVLKKHDYSKDYLTFEALETGTFTLTIPTNVDSTYMTSVSYSTDNGNTWNTTTVDNTAQTITTPSITKGNKVLWKGIGKQMSKSASSDNYSYFSSSGNFNARGNIMSLLYGDSFNEELSFPNNSSYTFTNLFEGANINNAQYMILPISTLVNYCYSKMFKNCANLISAPTLPATTLANSCYSSMFSGCTSLTTAPTLPATTLAENCYDSMFSGCTLLISAPELPATTLAKTCYTSMFRNCTSLTMAPELHATELTFGCYSGMFRGCTSLAVAPELPATTLTSSCYGNMFNGCTNLNYVKAMFTTTPSSSYTSTWVDGVSSTGTFVKNSTATWNVAGVDGIPTGWTVKTVAPYYPEPGDPHESGQ